MEVSEFERKARANGEKVLVSFATSKGTAKILTRLRIKKLNIWKLGPIFYWFNFGLNYSRHGWRVWKDFDCAQFLFQGKVSLGVFVVVFKTIYSFSGDIPIPWFTSSIHQTAWIKSDFELILITLLRYYFVKCVTSVKGRHCYFFKSAKLENIKASSFPLNRTKEKGLRCDGEEGHVAQFTIIWYSQARPNQGLHQAVAGDPP